MEIWQRGTSFSDIGNGDYTADRFFNQKNGTTNVERVSITDTEMLKYGFRYAMRQTAVAASQIKPLQIIEKHPLFVAGNKFTFSFWARSNSPISYTFQHYDGSSVFNSKTVYIETEWKRYVIPLTLTTTPSSYLRIHLTDTRNAGDWLETTGWQYEQGSVATPFEHRSYGEELALCQRYYEKFSADDGNGGYATFCGGGKSSNTVIVLEPVFRVPKRTCWSNNDLGGSIRFGGVAGVYGITMNSIQNAQLGIHGGYIVLVISSNTNPANGNDGYGT